MRSISARVHLMFFTFSIAVAVVMVTLMMIVNNDLEATMLQNDLDDEFNFLLKQHPQDQPVAWESAGIKIFYFPAGMSPTNNLPAVFRDLPMPFSGEVETKKHTYLVRTTQMPQSSIYVARDISAFEEREAAFQVILAMASAVMMVLTYFFAKVASQRLTLPLQDLALRIQGIVVGKQMSRVPLDYDDSELLTIAETFNTFLGELEAFVRREQSLTNLTSHELRTPIAVMSGAVDILLRRDNLDPSDKKTVERIRVACAGMSANVEMLLKLTRRSDPLKQFESVDVAALVREILDDLSQRLIIGARVDSSAVMPMTIHTDRTLLKMLLSNLIQNALQHTTGKVQVVAGEGEVAVIDQGGGLPAALCALISGAKVDTTDIAHGGLGLYIVSLICEKMGWRPQVESSQARGTVIRVPIRSFGSS